MPEKTLETKGIAEVSAAQLRMGAATGERARGGSKDVRVLARRSSKEGIFAVRGRVMGVHKLGGSKSHSSQVIQVPISTIIFASFHSPAEGW